VKTQDARNAIDAILAHQEVAVKHTGVFGCSTKWQEKASSRIAGLRKIEEQPVQLEMATAADLNTLRANPSKQMLLVSFWATWCGSCIAEFSDFEDTYRMYSVRDLGLVTVSTNMPDETNTVDARHQPQSAFCFERHCIPAGGIRPEVGVSRTLHRITGSWR
jgi:thiol-disulfide isomerase/thioredoxin